MNIAHDIRQQTHRRELAGDECQPTQRQFSLERAVRWRRAAIVDSRGSGHQHKGDLGLDLASTSEPVLLHSVRNMVSPASACNPQDLFAKDGLLDELKKALSERMLSAEFDDHLEKESAAGAINRRNGSSKQTMLTGGACQGSGDA